MNFLKKLTKPEFYLIFTNKLWLLKKKKESINSSLSLRISTAYNHHRHRLFNNLHHHQAISYCFLVASCVSLPIVPLLLTPIDN